MGDDKMEHYRTTVGMLGGFPFFTDNFFYHFGWIYFYRFGQSLEWSLPKLSEVIELIELMTL